MFFLIVMGAILWFAFVYLPKKTGSNKPNFNTNNLNQGLHDYDLNTTPYEYVFYMSEITTDDFSYKGNGMHITEGKNLLLHNEDEAEQSFFNLGPHSFFNRQQSWSFSFSIEFDASSKRFWLHNLVVNQEKIPPLNSNFVPIDNPKQADLYSLWLTSYQLIGSDFAKQILNSNVFCSMVVLNNLLKKGYISVNVENQVVDYEFTGPHSAELTRYLIDLYEAVSNNLDKTFDKYERIYSNQTETQKNSRIRDLDTALLAKIDKLLLTAEQGANENESLVAYQKAQKIMKQHNITHADIDQYRKEVS